MFIFKYITKKVICQEKFLPELTHSDRKEKKWTI